MHFRDCVYRDITLSFSHYHIKCMLSLAKLLGGGGGGAQPPHGKYWGGAIPPAPLYFRPCTAIKLFITTVLLHYSKFLSQCTHQVNMCSLDHISPRWSFGLCQEDPMRTRDHLFCACSCKRHFLYRPAYIICTSIYMVHWAILRINQDIPMWHNLA